MTECKLVHGAALEHRMRNYGNGIRNTESMKEGSKGSI